LWWGVKWEGLNCCLPCRRRPPLGGREGGREGVSTESASYVLKPLPFLPPSLPISGLARRLEEVLLAEGLGDDLVGGRERGREGRKEGG